jgi:hypothetical protein
VARGDRGRFLLPDGSTFEGTVVSSSDNADLLEGLDGKRRTFPGHSVKLVGSSPITPWSGLREGQVRIQPRSGERFDATFVSQDDHWLTVVDASGRERRLGSDDVRQAWRPKERLPSLYAVGSPGRTRNLWVSTAIRPDPGELVLTVKGAATMSVDYGLVDGLTVGASLTPGILQDSAGGVSGTVGARYGYRFLGWLWVTAGVEVSAGPEGQVVSFEALATGERGPARATLSWGPTPAGAAQLGSMGDLMAAGALAWRFTPAWSAVGEAWVGTDPGKHDVIGAAGARWEHGRFTVDAAVLTTPKRPVLPYLAVSWGARR